MKDKNILKEHTNMLLIRSDSRRSLRQSEENKCMWAQIKDIVTFLYVLLIDEDLCESRNDLIKFQSALLVYLCPFLFIIRRFPFLLISTRARWKVLDLTYNWIETRNKRPLVRDPDRSWRHCHTSIQLLGRSSWLNGQHVIFVFPGSFLLSSFSHCMSYIVSPS